MTEKLLSDSEVRRLAGADSKVITYPEIQRYPTLQKLFGNKNKLIILYLNENGPSGLVGHWVLLTRIKRDGKEIIEFSDSYGKQIDEALEYNDENKRKELDQEHGYLSRLLYDYLDGFEDSREVHYNELPLQKMKANINSCGRWCGMRAHFYEIPLEQWQSIWRKLGKDGYDLDDFIVKISDKILNKK